MVIRLLCTHIAAVLELPAMTLEQITVNYPGTNEQEVPVRRIQMYMMNLSTDQYIQFVQSLFGCMVWLKRLAVAMQPD